MNFIDIAIAKGYTEESLLGAGALKGQDGKDGADGKGAYELAVEKGFEGTDDEWLESLKGTDGKDGIDGQNGKDGIDGKDGEQNAIESISVNGTALTPDENKNVDITVPSTDGLVSEEQLTETLANYAKTEDLPSEYDDTQLSNRVAAIEDDYLKSSDKTELTTAIATAKTETIERILGESVNADFDTLQEVADWIQADTTSSAELMTRVTNIEADLVGKVDKVDGKGLSTNDLTDELLETIENGDAETVNGHTVKTDVPADAKFTDTVYDDTVSVRTGRFKTDENTKRFYSRINAPITMPIISKRANNGYICTSEMGANQFYVCDDIETGNWQSVSVDSVEIQGNILQIEYIESVGYYYMLTANENGGGIYFSEDLELWQPTMVNLSSEPTRLINSDNTMYVVTLMGEIGILNEINPMIIESLNFSYPNTTDVFKVHGCYILSNAPDGTASIYDSVALTELNDKYLEDGNNPEVYKIVYWNGYLVGLSQTGGLRITNARFREEIMNPFSHWVDASTIILQYSDGNMMIDDSASDIIILDNQLYIIGNHNVYRVEKDFTVKNMSDDAAQLNVDIYQVRKCIDSDGLIYRFEQNNVIKFTFECEELDSLTAIQRIYNKLV